MIIFRNLSIDLGRYLALIQDICYRHTKLINKSNMIYIDIRILAFIAFFIVNNFFKNHNVDKELFEIGRSILYVY